MLELRENFYTCNGEGSSPLDAMESSGVHSLRVEAAGEWRIVVKVSFPTEEFPAGD